MSENETTASAGELLDKLNELTGDDRKLARAILRVASEVMPYGGSIDTSGHDDTTATYQSLTDEFRDAFTPQTVDRLMAYADAPLGISRNNTGTDAPTGWAIPAMISKSTGT